MGFRTFIKPVAAWFNQIEHRINRSTFGRVFRLEDSGHPKAIEGARFFNEIRAGLTTFATMAYIIAVNAAVLSESGELKRDLVTSTAALAGLSSIAFGFLTNLPVALGPGMGLNAYFTYQVVGWHGTGNIPYRVALTAVFVEGFIFIFLALTGMRQWLINMIPATIKTACGVGIGLFLTEIGLSYSAGIGAITGGYATPLTIGGCPAEYLNEKGECVTHIMANPAMWIGITLGGILVAFLMAFRVKSAIIIGIAVVSVLSWPRNTSFTYFPHTEDGDSRFEFFRQVVAFHPIDNVLAAQEWNLTGTTTAKFFLALMTFLYVDIIDCTATLYSMARFCGVVEEDGDFPRSTIAYCTDAAFISIGSLLGCSPVTAFIESGAGIAEGGDAVPSFITLAFIPFSYSVAYGLIAGMLVYVVLNTMIWSVVYLTANSLEPVNYEDKEVYRWGMSTRNLPFWMKFIRKRVLRKNNDEAPGTKDCIDLADNDSTINNGSSRLGSADAKEIYALSDRARSPRSPLELH
ncbi:hypothetical protein SLS62_007470 [Diatrype stigma]|uniref:Uncharacterized protein n=1 Tax=Diatrype stigma TaxID=117547 RepID=A0AAN9UZB1_9PEZI